MLNFDRFNVEVCLLGIIALLRLQVYQFKVRLIAGTFVQTCVHELEFRSLGLDCESERDYESETDFEPEKDSDSDADSDKDNSKPSQ